MKRNISFFLLSTAFLFCISASAQNWVNGGNTLSGNGSLGTNSNHSLIFKTNNTERGRITNGGNWGIGTASPIGKFHVNGIGAFGNSATAANATRALNLVDVNAVMRVLRVHATNAPAVELISRTTAGGANVAYWDMYAEPSDASFRIRDRIGGGSGVDRLTITSTGRIGIGTVTPAFRLDIVNPEVGAAINVNNTFQGPANHSGATIYSVIGPGFGYGVQAYGGFRGIDASGVGGTYGGSVTGVFALASGVAGKGYRYGVFGRANGGANAYGVWGEATGASAFNVAGYFNGDVWAVSYHMISDRKFKAEVSLLQNTLVQLMKLKPVFFQFKSNDYTSMHLPKGKQLGLIADEVKLVFPELVEQAMHPASYDGQDRTKVIHPEIKYEGVNYQGLIPVLIASVQELSKKTDEIAVLKAKIEKLEALLTRNNSTTNNASWVYLEQAVPNPAHGNTTIRYTVPEEVISAQLVLTNSKGQTVKKMTLSSRNTGQLNLNTHGLAAGTYTYTLYVDGRTADSKQLFVAR